jgi:conjugal transfer mating pair stabilization protein TraG
MGAYVIHTYFNQQEMVGILNAVVMFCGGGSANADFITLIRTLGIIGLICAVCYGMWRARGEEAGYYVVMLAIVYCGLFLPRVTVIVEDNSGYSAGPPRAVDNVPVGLAFVVSATSKIGYFLTSRMETVFSVSGPDLFTGYPHPSLTYSSGGLMSMGRMYRTALEANVQDPIVQQDIINFMRYCINPEIIQSPTYVAGIIKSTDIWTDLAAYVNPGRIVSFVGDSEIRDCQSGYDILGAKITTQAAEEQKKIAAKIWPRATTVEQSALIAAALPAAEALVYTASGNIADAIRQRMVINVFDSMPGLMSRNLNDPSTAMTSLAMSQAAATTNSSYRVMASLAKETLPLIHNAIELVIVGVFPVIILIMVVAGVRAGKIFMNYALTFLWVQLWAPLYAIVNYIATMASVRGMKSALAGVDGLSITNAAALYNTVISHEAVAGMLTIAVPLLAFALVKGGEVAMSGAVTSILQTSNAAANQAGSQAGSGNANMGNVSWGTVQANNRGMNQSDLSTQYSSSDFANVKTSYGSYTARGDGSTGNLQAHMSNLGATAGIGAAVNANSTQRSGESASWSESGQASRMYGITATYTQAQEASAMRKVGKMLSETFGGGDSWAGSTESGTSHTTGSQAGFEQGSSYTQDQGLRMATKAGANAGVGINGRSDEQPAASSGFGEIWRRVKNLTPRMNGKLGVTAGMEGALVSQDTDRTSYSAKEGQSAEDRLTAAKNYRTAYDAVHKLMGQTADTGERAAMQKFLGSLSEATDARWGTTTQQQYGFSASEESVRSHSATADYGSNLGNQVGDAALREMAGNPDKVLKDAVQDPNRAREIAKGVAERAELPKEAFGREIKEPLSVAEVQEDGLGKVNEANMKNIPIVENAGGAVMGRARGAQERLVGASADSTPSLEAASARMEENKAKIERQAGYYAEKRQVEAGVNRVAERMFSDNGGGARLIKQTVFANLGGLIGLPGGAVSGTESPRQIHDALKMSADMDPEVKGRMISIAKRGQATDDDMRFMEERLKEDRFLGLNVNGSGKIR